MKPRQRCNGRWTSCPPAAAWPPTRGATRTVEEQKDVELSYPAVGFIATDYGNTGVSISVVDVDGETVVDILSTSRCAQPPATSAP